MGARPYKPETLDYAQPGGLADFLQGGGIDEGVFATEGLASVDNDLKGDVPHLKELLNRLVERGLLAGAYTRSRQSST
jgi:hypothetical protein